MVLQGRPSPCPTTKSTGLVGPALWCARKGGAISFCTRLVKPGFSLSERAEVKPT
jgi:hypothetical protein